MFSLIVGGPIDPWGASLALAAAFICVCVFSTAFIVNRRSRRELDQRHALATMEQRDKSDLAKRNADFSHEQSMAALGYKREVQLKQIGEGVVVSHRVDQGSHGGD